MWPVQVDPSTEVVAGRYELGPVIGRGGMGVVRRAVDLRLGRHVAVKLLRPDLAARGDVRRRFEDEARAAARLSHPAVVTVFDSGEDGEAAYLVMECLSGRTFADELMDGPLAPERVHALAVDLLGALNAAHNLGILHRDVKPGNVILTDDGRPKLADFGIAKTTEGVDHTTTGLIIGTPAYLAPERLAGDPATPASDLYSLAVMLYEALTGEKPFPGNTPMALAHAMQTATPPPLAMRRPGVDPRLAAAIDRGMARQPSERFRSAAEMLDLLVSDGAPGGSVTQLAPRPAATTVPFTQPTMPEAAVAATAGMGAWWAERDQTQRMALTLAVCAVVVVLLILAVALGRDGEAPAPATPTTIQPGASPLPAPLDDAIRQLEESVRR